MFDFVVDFPGNFNCLMCSMESEFLFTLENLLPKIWILKNSCMKIDKRLSTRQ
jgi:hypothetical protein